MRRLLVMTGLIAPLLLCSCVPSLHSLYTEKDVIFDPGLVGQWSQEGSEETWTFAKSGEKAYELIYRDPNGKTGEFEVRLLKVDGRLFLDLFPKNPDLDKAGFYMFHILPAHTFMIVRQIEPTLQMAMLDPEGVEKHLEAHPEAIGHEVVEGRIVLTAKPKELQAFLIEHEDREGLFGAFCNMTRTPKAKR